MNIEQIKNKSMLACKKISDTESSIWYTTEWNICSHIQNNLNKMFLEHSVDVELIKKDRRRPDMVIHKRGNNLDNLVVFQVKKNPSTDEIKKDLDKIRETFFNEPYSYKFGVFISVGKLPDTLPSFDINKIGIIEVYGWVAEEDIENKVFK
jgi:hypothetical protein